ncbi:MAG: hypothetical protein CO114_02710 [Euryarchaeota archaeon CG_4_9_14_3_um_filter_38_12]|nr:MAG: hypothetical protein CO114_02710 [Euryarchaeota archaeon CG_4_9_14_3_um_filter_38_12]
MAKRETRKDSLLRLISDLGGEATREQVNANLSKYWELSKEEKEIEEGVGKPLFWHHSASVCQALKDRDGYLENPKRGIWKITEAGKKYLSSMGYKPSLPIHTLPSQITEDLPLCKELRESQRNSENPTIFEEVLVKTFQHLGFSAEHIGGRDEPDVLIEDYKTILDSKTTKEGGITERYINFDAMERYKEKYNAKHIGIVAPGFSEGYIRETAEKKGFVLIEAEAICEILKNHSDYSYEPKQIVKILFESGKHIITPKDIPSSTIEQEKLIKIIAKILSDIESIGKPSFSSRELHIAYSWQKLNYEVDEIEKALKFLSSPPFSVLQKQDDEYYLTSDINSILKKIGLLLHAFKMRGGRI